jgi:hypothetical protein
MIVDLPNFESINRLEDLPAGRYVVVESVYRLAGATPCGAVLSELVAVDTGLAIGADLQIALRDGTLLFRDFAVARDGAWRDSYGAKARSLADLLPPELAGFMLVSRKGIVVSHDGRGRLSAEPKPEQSHGS